MTRLHFASTSDTDLFYLVRSRISDPFFLLQTEGKSYVFLNVLELGAFKERVSNIEAVALEPLLHRAREVPGDAHTMSKVALLVLEERGLLGEPIEVSRHFPLDMADHLRSQGVSLVVRSPLLPERAKKSEEEIEHIRESMRRACRAFGRVEEIVRESAIERSALSWRGGILTSERIKKEVEKLLFDEGMESPSGLILTSGVHAAMPHHQGAGPLRAHETIVCDVFPRSRESGYFADMTRTYVKGEPTPRAEAMYAAVKKAQDAGLKLVRPGACASELYAAAAESIRASGFDAGEKGFIHSLGHGLGLDIHEAPHLGAASKDILEVGNIITIEPGLYYPEEGSGVRLEDVVVVTENGCENLTNYPREFVIA